MRGFIERMCSAAGRISHGGSNKPSVVLWDGPLSAQQQAALVQAVDLILTHQLGLMALEAALSDEAARRGVKMEGDLL